MREVNCEDGRTKEKGGHRVVNEGGREKMGEGESRAVDEGGRGEGKRK